MEPPQPRPGFDARIRRLHQTYLLIGYWGWEEHTRTGSTSAGVCGNLGLFRFPCRYRNNRAGGLLTLGMRPRRFDGPLGRIPELELPPGTLQRASR
jgi:hypothetical protein